MTFSIILNTPDFPVSLKVVRREVAYQFWTPDNPNPQYLITYHGGFSTDVSGYATSYF